MWSDNKKVDYLVNTLIFLVAINFMHYGQLFLPLICLILFEDNKFKFKVYNIRLFALLCLFSMTFFAFSYKLGFYSVIGFCLPMAYYIGCNLKDKSEKSTKKLIYIIALGMASHMILNFAMELTFWYDNLSYMFDKSTHYDFWIQNKMSSTLTALNSVILISCSYYLFVYEEEVKFKILGIISFILVSIYNLALGRRTTLFIMLITIFVSLFIDIGIYRKKVINKNTIIEFILIFILLLLFIIVILYFNLFSIKDLIQNFSIFRRLFEVGLYSGRFDILISAIELAPQHLWGGREISKIIGLEIHDLWGDIYDYAGIVAYIEMIIISIYLFIEVFKKIILKKQNKLIILLIDIVLSIVLIMFLEPVLTGASIFLICSIIILSSVSCIE